MTGQRNAVRGNGQEGRAPAVHAGFGAILIIIRNDIINLHFAGDFFFEGLCDGFGLFELRLRGHQQVAIGMGPAIILGIGQFQIIGAEFFRHSPGFAFGGYFRDELRHTTPLDSRVF